MDYEQHFLFNVLGYNPQEIDLAQQNKTPSFGQLSHLPLPCNVIILYVPNNKHSIQSFWFAPDVLLNSGPHSVNFLTKADTGIKNQDPGIASQINSLSFLTFHPNEKK